MDEEDLLHMVKQASGQENFAEGFAGNARLNAPANGSQRYAFFHNLIQALGKLADGGGNGTANCRSDYRVDGVGKNLRMLPDGCLKGLFKDWFERFAEGFGARRFDCVGKKPGQIGGALFGVAQALLNTRNFVPLGADQQFAQLREAIGLGSRLRHYSSEPGMWN